jgi:ankyrin repeat protein
MLHRKLDWHDYEGAAWLLAKGADPNEVSHWGDRALHHALARENEVAFVRLLIEHGADPSLPAPGQDGMSALELARRAERADVLALLVPR